LVIHGTAVQVIIDKTCPVPSRANILSKGMNKMRKIILTFTTIAVLFAFSAISQASNNIRIIVNGKEIYSDVPPQIINDRVMVPVRFVSEALDASVNWDDTANSVNISTKTNSSINKEDVLNLYYINYYWNDKLRFIIDCESIISGINYSQQWQQDDDYEIAWEMLNTTKELISRSENYFLYGDPKTIGYPMMKEISSININDIDTTESMINQIYDLIHQSIDALERYFVTGNIDYLKVYVETSIKLINLTSETKDIVYDKATKSSNELSNGIRTL
jgi:hypothetical protein